MSERSEPNNISVNRYVFFSGMLIYCCAKRHRDARKIAAVGPRRTARQGFAAPALRFILNPIGLEPALLLVILFF
ncbi:hypothetical protein LJ656_22520 [Paraburkholderia sp. MMS20-SJTR3]|uniref:Uncharacterized protein n=1 Tax=Paraburkholderia sejongensis TaxID=2886946 RepID=A0ABS8JZN2_9BURK|nr:hypothetical protein [Paraburkholderia sp. MMS20-SJTR3]MCC8395367.1 hypothetical protein [Paraburkholderia sp. MMS20-SJTR3]